MKFQLLSLVVTISLQARAAAASPLSPIGNNAIAAPIAPMQIRAALAAHNEESTLVARGSPVHVSQESIDIAYQEEIQAASDAEVFGEVSGQRVQRKANPGERGSIND